MNLLQALRGSETRDDVLTFDDYALLLQQWTLGGTFPAVHQTLTGEKSEPIPNDFLGYVRQAYKANGIVFACQMTRLMLFSQIRFAFRARNRDNGRPGDLFHTSALDLLDTPWPGGTTSGLAARMIQDADFAGNNFLTVRDRRVYRLRPDWCFILLGSDLEPDDPELGMDAHVLGLWYDPPGAKSPIGERILLPGEFAHFAPIPDPEAHFRGMSWLTPVLREVRADGAATTHKLKFFDNAMTPSMIMRFDPTVAIEKARAFKEWVEEQHEGAWNAYKTLYVGGGADPQVVGKDFQQADFKKVQGAGETRIAAAAGVHPSIVGLSEGMEGSPLAEGNFQAARRLTVDRTLRFLWGDAAVSLQSLVRPPRGAELWYDGRDVAFLQEDEKDAAEIQRQQAATISVYVSAGFTPESAVSAVLNGDASLLDHTGLVSVQLLPPGSTGERQAVPVPISAVADLLARGWGVVHTNGDGDPDAARELIAAT